MKSATGYSLFVVSDLQFDIKSVRENERESVCVCVREREREREKGVGAKNKFMGTSF